ncbi:hypothetical protein GLP40_25310 [Nocardia sp. CT2-14]|uniref:DUF7159 domain-containing protein n=1 Tax=Nocardia aurantiaca TaxID=2675850 RepID=A0A6I3L448_9NOCA|nr:hypothetical protein [Nocardia aurantiaca]
MTLGVATERGTVRAVALADDGHKLTERVVLERVEPITGDTKADLAAAVESVLEDIADQIGADREILGAAVAYRDAAERRAIVTKLAAGPWHDASLVSAKAAHLSVARAMTWMDEFEDLAICEVVPGFQAFSLISPDRSRVLAAVALSGGAATEEAMRSAVTAAWDQFDAAGVKPDAVVLIGSAATESEVVAALESGFGAPVIPCAVSAAAPAIGAALSALPEAEFAGEAAERIRRSRGAAALFAAASVLVGGLVAGGVYAAGSDSKKVPQPMLIDSRVSADAHNGVEHPAGDAAVPSPDSGSTAPVVDGLPGNAVPPTDAVMPNSDQPALGLQPSDLVTIDPATLNWAPRGGNVRNGGKPRPLIQAQPEPEVASNPESIIPAPTHAVGAPTESGLFPGELAPPPLGADDFSSWWDNHWRMMLQWAAQLMPKV